MNNILLISSIVLYCSCSYKQSSFDINVVDQQLMNTIVEFQQRYIPNNDRVLLLEMHSCSPRVVFKLSKVEYPHLFADDKQYLVALVGSTVIFFRPSGSYDISFRIDTNRVKRIIVEKYQEYLAEKEYEIEFDAIHDAWYIFGEGRSKVFNMADSISVYGDIEEQYNKLNNLIAKY